jgi:hypothetical protein
MASYRVCFMNEIPRNDKLFHCCQRSIIVKSAPSAEQAVEAAKKQFAELEGIRDWKIHAAVTEVEAIDLEPNPETLRSERGPDRAKNVGHCEEL